MRTNLSTDPAILAIAKQCGITRQHVVGALHAIWSWADTHTADGVVHGVQAAFVDELASVEGFANAMIRVGWLIADDDTITIPNFERFMSTSAKSRMLAARRKAAQRSRNGHAPSVTAAGPHNITEQNIITHNNNTVVGGAADRRVAVGEALERAGITSDVAADLADEPHVTPEIVDAVVAHVNRQPNIRTPAGLVVKLLRNPPAEIHAAVRESAERRQRDAARQAELDQHEQDREAVANIPQAEWPRIAESAADWLRAHGRDADADELQRWGQRVEKLPPAAIAALAATVKTE